MSGSLGESAGRLGTVTWGHREGRFQRKRHHVQHEGPQRLGTMNLRCGPASTGVSIAQGVFSLKDRAKTTTVRASKSRFCLVRVEGAEGSGETYELPGPGR